MATEERLINLEAKIAHQDQALLELSEEVYQQQKRLAELETTCEYLLGRVRAQPAAAGPEDSGDEQPPHY